MGIVWNESDGETFKSMYIEEPRVVEDEFMASGTLMMYFKQEAPEGVAIAPLPFTSGTDFLYFAIGDVPEEGIEGIVVVNRATDGSTPVDEMAGVEIRYVMIPGGVAAKMGEGFLKDYSAVKEYFHLPN